MCEMRFWRWLACSNNSGRYWGGRGSIRKADERFDAHLARLKKERK
jgi:hypothetical protein